MDLNENALQCSKRATRLVTLLLEEVCPSRNSILLKTQARIYTGIGRVPLNITNCLLLPMELLSEMFVGYVSILHTSAICLTSQSTRDTNAEVIPKLKTREILRRARDKTAKENPCAYMKRRCVAKFLTN